MEWAAAVCFAGISGILIYRLQMEVKKRKELEKELDMAKKKLEEKPDGAEKARELRNAVWQSINTVHLYASLSREEAKTRSLREKQGEILAACQEIFRRLR
ncbi:MAG: hypothetical protein ACOYA8_02255 [Clostridium sp.]|jgi:glucose-6-phosphate-specific signal transduction histidine kinase